MARYQELLAVEIYAYCVLSNHLHLLARAPRSNMDEFCENVHREIARRINWKYKREGRLWAKRYDDLEILSEEDLIEAFIYINTNPTKHGLIKESKDWPGLSSYQHALTESDRSFSFHHYTGIQRVTTHKLKLSVLPPFKDLGKNQRIEKIAKLFKARINELSEQRKGQFLGQQAILEIEPGERPKSIARASRPPCYTKCSKLRREFVQAERLRRERYTEASARYRLGLRCQFPEFTFKPPLNRLPRIRPFTPLTRSCFKFAA